MAMEVRVTPPEPNQSPDSPAPKEEEGEVSVRRFTLTADRRRPAKTTPKTKTSTTSGLESDPLLAEEGVIAEDVGQAALTVKVSRRKKKKPRRGSVKRKRRPSISRARRPSITKTMSAAVFAAAKKAAAKAAISSGSATAPTPTPADEAPPPVIPKKRRRGHMHSRLASVISLGSGIRTKGRRSRSVYTRTNRASKLLPDRVVRSIKKDTIMSPTAESIQEGKLTTGSDSEFQIDSEVLESLPSGFDTMPLASQGYELHAFAATNNLPRLDKLLRLGADVNMIDKADRTGLHYAVMGGWPEVVERLLCCRELRAARADRWGYSALHLAVLLERVQCLRLLLAFGRGMPEGKGGSEEEGEEEEGRSSAAGRRFPSPLELARRSSNPELVKCFDKQDEGLSELLDLIRDASVTPSRLQRFIVGRMPDLETLTRDLQQGSPIGLCASLPEKSEVLQLLVDNHAKISKPMLKICLPEYRDLLAAALRRQKREYVLMELLSTEKTFLDDLSLTIGIFYEKPNIERLLRQTRVEPSVVLGVFDVIQVLRAKHLAILKRLQNLSHSGVEMRFRTDWCEAQGFLQTLSDLIEPELFLDYAEKFNRMDGVMKSDSSLSALVSFFNSQSQLIPYPKCRVMASMLGAPRIRLVKYRDLCSRLADYSDAKSESELKTLALRVARHVTAILAEMDDIVGRLLDEEKQTNVYRIWKTRYRLPETSVDSTKSFAFGGRKYLSHSLDLPSWNLLTEGGRQVIKAKDVFLFTDSLWIGSPGVKTLEGCFFRDTKTMFSFSVDSFRLAICDSDRKKIVDVQFLFPMSSLWQRTLSEFISHPDRRSQYENRILVISRLEDNVQMSKFMCRSKSVTQQEVLTQRSERLTNLISQLEKERADVEQRLSNLAPTVRRIQIMAPGRDLKKFASRRRRRRSRVLPMSPCSVHEPTSPMVLVRGKLKLVEGES